MCAFLANPEAYLELSDVQVTKLKQLTLVTLAAEDKVSHPTVPVTLALWRCFIFLYIRAAVYCVLCQVLAYNALQKELDVSSVRALEDLIIEAMYAVRLCTFIFKHSRLFLA